MDWPLLLSLVALVLTLNAWRPVHWPSSVALVSFFAGWLTAELAIQHAAWQAAIAVWLVVGGRVASGQGQAALVVFGASIIGLLLLHRRAMLARANIEGALREGLGEGYEARFAPGLERWLDAPLAWTKIAFPFPVRESSVETTRNVPFVKHGTRALTLDIHRHKSHPTRCPTLVYVHGGGWVIGQRRYQGLPLMKLLASRGWVCFSVDYRLSPRATFPEHLVDVKRALAWVREHAAEYGADPEFIVLGGNSAGAHLAALTALTANDPKYQPGFESTDTRVSACIGLYGVYDFTNHHGQWRNGGMKMLLERYVMKMPMATSRDAYVAASPLHLVHEDAPPFFVVHGDSDTLASTMSARSFAAALRAKSRAPVLYAEIPHAQHAFEIFPSPRAAHFLTGATHFVTHVYSRHLEARGADASAALRAVSSEEAAHEAASHVDAEPSTAAG